MEDKALKNTKIKKIIAISLCTATLLSLGACGKKKDKEKNKDESKPSVEETAGSSATQTTQPPQAAALPTLSGPMTNPNEVTWTVTPMDPTIKYANVNESLPVRSGPGSSYDQVGVLTRNQKVIVDGVATNSSNEQWYKTQDGFYITANSTYVVDNPV